jgi:hypothetical protein
MIGVNVYTTKQSIFVVYMVLSRMARDGILMVIRDFGVGKEPVRF